jgi:hypothetical protein
MTFYYTIHSNLMFKMNKYYKRDKFNKKRLQWQSKNETLNKLIFYLYRWWRIQKFYNVSLSVNKTVRTFICKNKLSLLDRSTIVKLKQKVRFLKQLGIFLFIPLYYSYVNWLWNIL